MIEKQDLKIVFFGTPEFAATSLKIIFEAGYRIVAVVTAPDKAAGRGYQMQASEVKKTALELGLPVLQPENLKSETFLEELRSCQADLQIVIAFRMLPESVWSMPKMGTFNLHASYLPYYRGAAPINRAIMNGETETGVSTFFLNHAIDTGNIILREKVAIEPNDNAGTLYEKLMFKGAELVLKSLHLILNDEVKLIEQEAGDFPHAPKIFTDTCKIDWQKNALDIHNQIRGLSPYPAAFADFQGKKMKIYASQLCDERSSEAGKYETRGQRLYVHCSDLLLELTDVQLEGKKRMPVKDFLNGVKLS